MVSLIHLVSFLPLLFVGGKAGLLGLRSSRDGLAAVAAAGWGGWKIWLALEIREMFELCQQASAEATGAGAAFIGMLSFALAFCLWIGGVGDLMTALAWVFGRSTVPLWQRPWGRAEWVDFWCQWGSASPSEEPRVSLERAVIRCAWFMVSMVLWAGYQSGMGTWMILQVALMKSDAWLGRGSWWAQRVPHGLRSGGLVVLFLLGMPLLYSGGVEMAWDKWTRLFSPPAESFASLILDARLTTPRACWLLSLGAVWVLVPGVHWVRGQGRMGRWVLISSGLIAAVLGLLTLLSGRLGVEPGERSLGRVIYRFLHTDGDHGVSIGAEGWLYPQAEWQRFTQPSTPSPLTEEMIQKALQWRAQGRSLLVLPVPDKIMLQPEPLLPGSYAHPVYPPGYLARVAKLREAGADVLDLTGKLWAQRKRRPLHFHRDSHWRWEGMKDMTVQLARHLRQRYPDIFRNETPLIDAVFEVRHDEGDLAKHLQASNGLQQGDVEACELVGISGLQGESSSPVLIIGGDLIQMYDDPELSFGPALPVSRKAGFPTQLGTLIGQATATLRDDELSRQPDRLAGKQVIIWVVRAGEL